MKRPQKINLPSCWIGGVSDKGDKGIEVQLTGTNTKNTRVEQTVTFDEWALNLLIKQYAEILKSREVKANQQRLNLVKITAI